MCGRYEGFDISNVREHFPLPRKTTLDLKNWHGRNNVRPTNMMPVVTLKDGKFDIELMRWQLILSYPGKEFKVINTRKDKLTGTYRQYFEKHRCAVLANGFYEWLTGDKIPYYFSLKDQPLFSFAGIYQEGEQYNSFSIITGEPNGLVRPYHDRQAVILPKELEQRWLDPSMETGALLNMLAPLPAELMQVSHGYIEPTAPADLNIYKNQKTPAEL